MPLPYPTLGVDRAAALSLVERHPALILDGGTALTFGKTNAEGVLVEGGIVPGLALRYQSLHDVTGLPNVSVGFAPSDAPPLGNLQSTADSIQAAVLMDYESTVKQLAEGWTNDIYVLGGDAPYLQHALEGCSKIKLVKHATARAMECLLQKESPKETTPDDQLRQQILGQRVIVGKTRGIVTWMRKSGEVKDDVFVVRLDGKGTEKELGIGDLYSTCYDCLCEWRMLLIVLQIR